LYDLSVIDDAEGSDASTGRCHSAIFDNPLFGVFFMAERVFLQVNPTMEAMLGYQPGGLAGRSVRDVYANADDFAAVGGILESFPKSNRYVHERALVTRTGGALWCLISGSFIDRAHPGELSLWVVQDISSRKRAEEQLVRARQRLEQTVERRTLNLQRTNKALKLEVERRRASDRSLLESREKYRVLIRNTPAGVLLTDAEGAVVEINPARGPAVRDLRPWAIRADRRADDGSAGEVRAYGNAARLSRHCGSDRRTQGAAHRDTLGRS